MLEENLIQIAGVIDAAEAEMLQQCGIRYLGFPLRLPVHREDLSERTAAAIITSLRAPVFGVLITYLAEASAIAALRTSTIQSVRRSASVIEEAKSVIGSSFARAASCETGGDGDSR